MTRGLRRLGDSLLANLAARARRAAVPSGVGRTVGRLVALDAPPAPRAPSAPASRRRVVLPSCPTAAVARLEADLGIGTVTAQVLVRRGLAEPEAARAWLASREEHPPEAFQGVEAALAVLRRHLAAGSRITVHGDYDVDGVCATAILVRALRALGGDVDWYLPSRLEDGYGLNARTVERLAARGTRLLVTADCAITAVAEVAQARAAGLDVVVTDHHAPRREAEGEAVGALPDAPIVHPGLCGYPCPELCAAGVALKLAEALGAPTAAEDLDLAALATVADVVALRGENRRLVRAGLRALATTDKPGLRALMRVARVDPTRLDARDLGFRLAPRINAAGRLYRADAGLELVLTEDPRRAEEVADELDRANAERRHVEQRMLFEAEAQVAEQDRAHEAAGRGSGAAYVLAAEGWHPGVVGIVASRIAERHHRPAVLLALAGERATGSARSIPAYDLLAGLDASAEHLLRHGGHRAAAGLELDVERLEDFRAAFTAHAEQVLAPDDLVPEERVDAVVAGGDLGLGLAEELERLAPFGHGNPGVSLLLPAARLVDPRPMGEGRHVRFTVEAGGTRSRAVAFGNGGRLPVAPGEPADMTFTLELDHWGGTVEPRLVLRHAQPCAPEPITVLDQDATEDYLAATFAELDAPLGEQGDTGATREPGPTAGSKNGPGSGGPRQRSRRAVRDRRGLGVAGTVAALVASGEPTLVVCADVARRLPGLAPRLGGFALASHAALARRPELAAEAAHVVLVDPPADADQLDALLAGDPAQTVHLAWGAPELDFALRIHEHEHDLRAELAGLYRALRDRGSVAGERLEGVLRGDPDRPRPPRRAGRALRVLVELGLVELDRAARTLAVPAAQRTELERSSAYRAYERRARRARAFLSTGAARAG